MTTDEPGIAGPGFRGVRLRLCLGSGVSQSPDFRTGDLLNNQII